MRGSSVNRKFYISLAIPIIVMVFSALLLCGFQLQKLFLERSKVARGPSDLVQVASFIEGSISTVGMSGFEVKVAGVQLRSEDGGFSTLRLQIPANQLADFISEKKLLLPIQWEIFSFNEEQAKSLDPKVPLAVHTSINNQVQIKNNVINIPLNVSDVSGIKDGYVEVLLKLRLINRLGGYVALKEAKQCQDPWLTCVLDISDPVLVDSEFSKNQKNIEWIQMASVSLMGLGFLYWLYLRYGLLIMAKNHYTKNKIIHIGSID